MSLIKGGELVEDTFFDASGAETIPPSGPVIVSLDAMASAARRAARSAARRSGCAYTATSRPRRSPTTSAASR